MQPKFIVLQPWDWLGLLPTEPLSQGVDLNMVPSRSQEKEGKWGRFTYLQSSFSSFVSLLYFVSLSEGVC